VTAADPPITVVREIVARAIAEDLEPLGDITSALLPPGLQATASFVAREEGVVAGRLAVLETFEQVDPDVRIEWSLDDGVTVEPGNEIAKVSGALTSILVAERTALNFLCHLSGIATLTRRFVRSSHGQCRIWDTRKTTPGLRALEKAAVRAGGGRNHRGNLSEWVLLKDNHLAGMPIAEAVSRARERWPGRTVEVEADTLEQVAEAIDAAADIVLLDNMTPKQAASCVQLRGDRDRPLLEVSGGVSLHTISEYAATGVDLISVGALTHSAPILDIGLDVTGTSRS
jgi:nicotinate-nucleotide pyrophosphorylase (carboxylating)